MRDKASINESQLKSLFFFLIVTTLLSIHPIVFFSYTVAVAVSWAEVSSLSPSTLTLMDTMEMPVS